MKLETLDGPGLDYAPARYGRSKILFRGPRNPLQAPYAAFVGGSETYGKFVARPFPALVEEATEISCANFGCLNAGIDAFASDETILAACEAAAVTVVQVMGANNLSNRFYSVHPRRNDRFVKASPLLKAIYREVDFTEFHFTRHMLGTLCALSPERFAIIVDELQQAWLARMQMLLRRIRGKKILLWFAERRPGDWEMPTAPEMLSRDPLFITGRMIETLASEVTRVVEVRPSARARRAGTEGMVFAPHEAAAAAGLPGPLAHREAAAALCGPLGGLIGAAGRHEKGPPPDGDRP